MLVTKTASISIRTVIASTYISQARIDQTKQKYYRPTFIARVRYLAEMVKLIIIDGYRNAKKDVKRFNQIRKIQENQRSYQQQKQLVQIKKDMVKSIPAIIILNLPFVAGPLFFAYLKLLPNVVPSWLITESVHNSLILLKKTNRKFALNYFKKTLGNIQLRDLALKIAQIYLIKSTDRVSTDHQDLRMINNLLTGGYKDGTYYTTHLSPLKNNVKMDYFVQLQLSRWLLVRNIYKYVQQDTTHRLQYKKYTQFTDRLIFHLQLRINKILETESLQ